MEYVRGRDVLQIQNRYRRRDEMLPLPMAALIAAKVCEGLDYAHRKLGPDKTPLNIVHRDVSPQNILVSYDGEIKLIDFGIAKAVSSSAKTRAGVLKGKFGYMSPEQVRGQRVDRRSDLFALGTVLWEMCTGSRLFKGASDFAVLDKVRNATVPRPSTHNPEIPQDLEAIIMKALRRHEGERYQWASEMQDALRTYLATQTPRWSATSLASALEEMFQEEIARDQEAFERYQRLGADGAVAEVSPIGNRATLVSSEDRDAPPPRARSVPTRETGDIPSQPVGRRFSSDIDDATEVTQSPASIVATPSEDLADPTLDEIGGHEESLEHTATHIYGPSIDGAGEGLNVEPTFVFNVESGGLAHVGTQPEAVSAPGGNGEGPDAVVPNKSPTVIFEANLAASPEVDGSVEDVEAFLADRAPEVPRPSLAKDLLVGMFAAMVIIAAAGALWYFAFHGRSDRLATLVISATGVTQAEVFVDGHLKGTITAGKRMTVTGVRPGAHRLALLAEGAEPVIRNVEVAPGEVKGLALKLPPRVEGSPVPADASPAGREPDQGSTADAAAAVASEEPVADRRKRHESDAPPPAKRGKRPIVPPSPPVSKPATAEPRKRARSEVPRLRRRRGRAGGTERKPAPAKPEKAKQEREEEGYLVASTTPWAKVLVDGEDTGRVTPIVPRSKLALPPGPHEITFVVGEERFSYRIRVRPGRVTRLIKTLPLE
jgi:hypothetical protein